MEGTGKLSAAIQKGPTFDFGSLAEPHLFTLPPNTAGQAKLREKPQPLAISQPPPPCQGLPGNLPGFYIAPARAPAPPVSKLHASPPLIFPSVQLPKMAPGTSQLLFHMPFASPVPPAFPYTTQLYRKKKEQRAQSDTVMRKYIKKTDVILCKQCNKDRKPPSHRQYFGNWYCEVSATQTYDEWRAQLQQQGNGKEKPAS